MHTTLCQFTEKPKLVSNFPFPLSLSLSFFLSHYTHIHTYMHTNNSYQLDMFAYQAGVVLFAMGSNIITWFT